MHFASSPFHEAVEHVQGLEPLFVPYQIHDTTWLPSPYTRLHDWIRQRLDREYSSELYSKLSVCFHRKGTDEVVVTIIRLDNAADDGQGDFYYKPSDRLWRAVQGWSSPLELCFQGQASCVRVPANRDLDTLQFSLQADQVPALDAPSHRRDIPDNLFFIWNDPSLSDCPAVLQKTMAITALLNPAFKVNYFDHDRARDYIQAHEPAPVLAAYDHLVPRAFKVDFWRYIVLYHEGGIYLDAKIAAIYPLHAFLPRTGGLLVNDIRGAGLLNGILAMPKHSPLMRRAIEGIVEHVHQRFYGQSPLDISGPNHLYSCFNAIAEQQRTSFKRIQFDLTGILVRDGRLPVLAVHNGEYRRALSRPGMALHYEEIWDQRTVYGEVPIPIHEPGHSILMPLIMALAVVVLALSWMWRRSAKRHKLASHRK